MIKESRARINHPRFYNTERGFQGMFLSELIQRLPCLQWKGPIIEQEYQKKMKDHGIRIRPDIIIHVLFDKSLHNTRTEGNFVVFELKLNASESEALQDLEKLSKMCEVLRYPLDIFINISTTTTHLSQFQGIYKEKLHAFAVILNQ